MATRHIVSSGGDIDCDGASDRYLIRTIHGENNGFVGVLQSCSFGGVDGTILRQDFLAGNQLWYAEVAWDEAEIASAGAGLQVFADVWDANPPAHTATNYCAQDVDQTTPSNDAVVASNSAGVPSTPTLAVLANGLAFTVVASGSGGATFTWTNYTEALSQSPSGYGLSSADQALVSADPVLATEYDATSANRSFLLARALNDAGSPPIGPITGDLLPVTVEVDKKYMGVTPAVNGMMHLDAPDSGGELSFLLSTPIDFGTLVTFLDGQFTYTPPGGFVGEATFGYTLYEHGVPKPEVTIHIVVEAASGGVGVAISANASASGSGTVVLAGVGAAISEDAIASGVGTAVPAVNVVGSGVAVSQNAIAVGVQIPTTTLRKLFVSAIG